MARFPLSAKRSRFISTITTTWLTKSIQTIPAQRIQRQLRASACCANKNTNRMRCIHTSGPRFASASDKDYYDILGINKSASKDEIKKAYRALAKKHHPDLNQGNPEAAKRFSEINNAYDVLSDDEKRKAYDMFGAEGAEAASAGGGGFPGGFGGFPGGNPFGGFARGGGSGGVNLEDLFGDIFGGSSGLGGGRMRRPSRGENVEVLARLSFEEAVSGLKRDVEYQRKRTCQTCGGSGHKPKATATTCKSCKGRGAVVLQQGFMQVQATCSTCGGTGKIQPECTDCHGSGLISERKTLNVTIPAGVDDSDVLRIPRQGNDGSLGGPPGDLHVRLSVAPSRTFVRKGADVFCDAAIDLTKAVLGGTVTVPTLTGEADVKVEPGTQAEQSVRLRGKGFKRPEGGASGDQYVTFKVQIPRTLTPQQRDLFIKLRALMDPKSAETKSADTTSNANPNDSSSSSSTDSKSGSSFFGKVFGNEKSS